MAKAQLDIDLELVDEQEFDEGIERVVSTSGGMVFVETPGSILMNQKKILDMKEGQYISCFAASDKALHVLTSDGEKAGLVTRDLATGFSDEAQLSKNFDLLKVSYQGAPLGLEKQNGILLGIKNGLVYSRFEKPESLRDVGVMEDCYAVLRADALEVSRPEGLKVFPGIQPNDCLACNSRYAFVGGFSSVSAYTAHGLAKGFDLEEQIEGQISDIAASDSHLYIAHGNVLSKFEIIEYVRIPLNEFRKMYGDLEKVHKNSATVMKGLGLSD